MNIDHTAKRYRRLRALYGLLGYGVYALLASHMSLDDDNWMYRLGLEAELGISKKREREILAYILDADNGFVEYANSRDERDAMFRLVSTSNVSSNDSSKTLVSTSKTSSTSSDSTSTKRGYKLSEKALNQRKRAQAQRNQITKSTKTDNEINNGINEIEQRNGGIIGGNNNNTLVGLENIEGIPLEDKSTTTITKETKAQKSQKTSATSYVRELRAVFDEYYRWLTKSEFYWDAKHMSHLKKISGQLTAGMREKGIEITGDGVAASFRALLSSIQDKWILDNLSPAVISSKFNEIRMQYARNHHTAGVAGLGSGYDSLRRAFAAGLVPDTGTA